MGREYFGDIEGKFAFSIQNSDDIENLVAIDYRVQYSYCVCQCIVENIENKYCSDCYDSYEEHLKIAREDEYLCQNENILTKEDNIIIYDIEKEKHLNELNKNMNEIQDLLPPNVIKEFNKIKDDDEIIDGYSDIFSKAFSEMDKYVEKDFKIIYRYKLGLQVTYILNRQDTCTMYCEVY